MLGNLCAIMTLVVEVGTIYEGIRGAVIIHQGFDVGEVLLRLVEGLALDVLQLEMHRVE